jgi:tRNA(Ile)-lysidine synthase
VTRVRARGSDAPGGSAAPLADRFRRHWLEETWTQPGERVVVACSGGLDSLVLLHLLRFESAALDLRVEAAHFDHRMRPESAKDAEWLRGLCSAWGIPLHVGVAPEVPADEASARRLRYGFMERFLRSGAARWVVTAHHEDDQIETVLFRVLRGTGVRGLSGIPSSRPPGILRPLLPFTRAELETYAEARLLRPRLDASNASLRFARNRIRHRLVPLLEEVHPGARAGLLRLARNSARTVKALEASIAPELDRIVVTSHDWGIVFDRELLAGYPESLRGELLRAAADSVKIRLSEAGTALAVQFITSGSSGSALELGGGVELRRDFDRLRLVRMTEEASSANTRQGGLEGSTPIPRLAIASPGSGAGTIELGGRAYALRWRAAGDDPDEAHALEAAHWDRATFAPNELSFPVCVRGWQPGDRARIPGGRRRKLKKVFREMRVPKQERGRVPVLVDSEGLVVWVAGGEGGHPASGRASWILGVRALETV